MSSSASNVHLHHDAPNNNEHSQTLLTYFPTSTGTRVYGGVAARHYRLVRRAQNPVECPAVSPAYPTCDWLADYANSIAHFSGNRGQ